MTDRLEEDAWGYIQKIDELGGIIRAIELGYPQREISDASFHYQCQLEKLDKVIVGVNQYQMAEEAPIPILKIDEEVERKQIASLQEMKHNRDNARVQAQLKQLEQAAHEGGNLMACFVDAVREYCTLGEIVQVLRKVFGEYQDPGML